MLIRIIRIAMRLRTKSWAVSPDTCNRQRGLRSLPHLRERFKLRTDDYILPQLRAVRTIHSPRPNFSIRAGASVL